MDKCPTCGGPDQRRANATAVLKAAEEVLRRALAEIRAEDDDGSAGRLVPI